MRRTLGLAVGIALLWAPMAQAQDAGIDRLAQATQIVPVLNVITGLMAAVYHDGVAARPDALREEQLRKQQEALEPTVPITDVDSGVFTGG